MRRKNRFQNWVRCKGRSEDGNESWFPRQAALERRTRLQSELKSLSDQLNNATILTSEDISTDSAGVGCVVVCKDKNGTHATFTLLGPWDADPEKNILSMQSKLAQTIKGLKVGEKFSSQGDEYTIEEIKSFL